LLPLRADGSVVMSNAAMPLFSNVDLIALFWFLAAWIGYSVVIEMTPRGKAGLNGLMHRYRALWMECWRAICA
jgi:uncharacterized membrane protein